MGKTKELLIEIMRGDEELGLYDNNTAIGMHTLTDTTTGCNSSRFGKQETLEEAAEKFAINIQTKAGTMSRENAIEWFKAGAKWQKERIYSEEEVKKLIIDFLFEKGIGREVKNVEEWFEQFKKK